ncbi:MAG: hypothetical protein WCP52_13010 [Bacteroidota bacterium]
MRKTIILLACTAFVACNKNGKEEQKANAVVWAETAETTMPMTKDSLWSQEDWDKTYKLDKPQIFNSITKAVRSGKLKACSFLNLDIDYTIPEFDAILSHWDSTHQVDDVNNPGTMISAPLKYDTNPDDISQIRFQEKIVFDTLTNTLTKKVTSALFLQYAKSQSGEILGMKPLFRVKFPDGNSAAEKK